MEHISAIVDRIMARIDINAVWDQVAKRIIDHVTEHEDRYEQAQNGVVVPIMSKESLAKLRDTCGEIGGYASADEYETAWRDKMTPDEQAQHDAVVDAFDHAEPAETMSRAEIVDQFIREHFDFEEGGGLPLSTIWNEFVEYSRWDEEKPSHTKIPTMSRTWFRQIIKESDGLSTEKIDGQIWVTGIKFKD